MVEYSVILEILRVEPVCWVNLYLSEEGLTFEIPESQTPFKNTVHKMF